MNGTTAAQAVVAACGEAFAPQAALEAAAALMGHLSFPIEDMTAAAYAEADGVQIRRAAWLAEFYTELTKGIE